MIKTNVIMNPELAPNIPEFIPTKIPSIIAKI